MGVIHQRQPIAVTAGEGDGPDAATLALDLAGTPATLFGTAYASGTATTFLRTDDTILFPGTLLSSTTSTTLALTDDGVDQTLTGNVGVLNIIPGTRVFIDGPVSGAKDPALSVRARPGDGTGALTAISAQISNPTQGISGATFEALGFSSTLAFTATSCNIVGIDLSANATLSAGSGGSNALYGARITGGLVNNANGSWSEVAGLSISGPRRLISNPTVTIAEGIVLECPTISATTQAGIYVKQRTAQQGATNRHGILMDGQNSGTTRYSFYASGHNTGTPTNVYGLFQASHAVGTNKWSYWGGNKFHCDSSDFIANASGFGFSNRDSQSSSAGGGGTARYWRMYADASATGVAGDVTIAIDSVGNVTATRAGGATGTVLLVLKDVGTAPVAT